jgi:aryl-alcohol dehydrogenase-like predicted oxidoreductase
MDDSDPNARGNHRRHIIQACEDSLRRLKTDHIDLYQLHRPDAGIPLDETLRALDDLITAGKVLYASTSTFAAWQIVEGLWISKELGLNRLVSEQPPYNLLDRRAEREPIPMAQTYGLAVLPWSPLAGGALTGKYRRGEQAPEGARYGRSGIPDALDKAEDRALLSDSVFDLIDVLLALAESRGCPPSQLALAWVLNQRGVTSPIIGPRTLEQSIDNLAALDLEIGDEEEARLDEVATPGRAVSPFYDADFGPHPYRW